VGHSFLLRRPIMTSDDEKPAVRAHEGDLLARHSRGDAHAFAEFVACYRRPVYGYLARCGVDEPTREDLFQEIFTRIHRGAASYRPERPVKPWVFAIAANVVRSHFRRPRDAQALEADPIEDAAPDVHALVEARETAVWLEGAIAALPMAQREVVILSCIEQLAQDDVAAALDIPVNTVKTHLRRGRIALAHALARRKAAIRREGTK
jgi:RNA polymerase sigma-70 factor, ECF subfamily